MKTGKQRFRLPYTTEQVKNMLIACYDSEVKCRHWTPIHDDTVLDHINQAASWLCDTNKFGLMLGGTPGNGKTTLMNAIVDVINFADVHDENDTPCKVRTVEAKELVRLCQSEPLSYKRLLTCDMLAIDDLGCEPTEVVVYGNIVTPLIDLLSHRYNEQLFTIVTTNLPPPQFREKYGDRIADRFKEMMNKIKFEAPSYRLPMEKL